jgi:hypothetical protein
MKRNPVANSSSLRAVGYDPAVLILEIEFSSGAVYQYRGVPQATYDGLIHAAKPGDFFVTFVRPCYEYERQHGFGCFGSLPTLSCREDCPCWCHRAKKKEETDGTTTQSESAAPASKAPGRTQKKTKARGA